MNAEPRLQESRADGPFSCLGGMTLKCGNKLGGVRPEESENGKLDKGWLGGTVRGRS